MPRSQAYLHKWGWLSAWRIRLCLVWFLPPPGDRADFRDIAYGWVFRRPLAMGDPVRYAQIATLSAFVVAAVCIFAWILRLSTLTSFISETVLLGFKAGAALSIAVTQIPALLGIPGGGHNFIERLFAITGQIFRVDPVVTSIGCGGLLLLWFGQKFLPGRPIALFVVVISIAFISMRPAARYCEGCYCGSGRVYAAAYPSRGA